MRTSGDFVDIEVGRLELMPGAAEIDDGEFITQMKVPKRERDLSTGQLRFRWSNQGRWSTSGTRTRLIIWPVST